MVAVATVTTSSFGQPPRSCLCIGLRSIFATALAARFPGFGVGDRPSVVVPTPTTGCHHRAGTNRRDHRYLEYPSNRADLINYLDQMCINYRDRSHEMVFSHEYSEIIRRTPGSRPGYSGILPALAALSAELASYFVLLLIMLSILVILGLIRSI
jgi:hypothetical protein